MYTINLHCSHRLGAGPGCYASYGCERTVWPGFGFFLGGKEWEEPGSRCIYLEEAEPTFGQIHTEIQGWVLNADVTEKYEWGLHQKIETGRGWAWTLTGSSLGLLLSTLPSSLSRCSPWLSWQPGVLVIKTRRGQRRGGGKDEERARDDDQCVPGRDSAPAAPFPRKTQQLLAMYVFSFDQMH